MISKSIDRNAHPVIKFYMCSSEKKIKENNGEIMNNCNYSSVDRKLNEIYTTIHPRLVARYAGLFGKFGGDMYDALAKALQYSTKVLFAKEGGFTARDVEALVCNKMNLLLKDARTAATLTHGRRSVKAVAILDAEPEGSDDYRVPLVDKASFARYAESAYCEGDENRFLLKLRAIETTLRENGTTDRDYAIFDKATFCKADRAALAASFKTSVANVNRITCECRQRACKLASQIRACYDGLLMEYGLEAA